jgi:hypothetical protein
MTAPEAAELEAVDAALAGRPVDPDHAALAELALLLRDDRPQPTPAWAADLDRRAEAGFPSPPRAPRRSRVWLRQAMPAIAIILLVTPIALIAALAPNGDDDDGGGAGGGASAGVEASGGSGGAGVEPLRGGGSVGTQRRGDAASDGRARRNVQRAAELTLAVPRRELDRVAGRVADVAANLGGYVASSSVSSSDGGDLRLRVPTGRLDTAIQRLSRLGRVRDLSRSSLDITSTVVSARERLTDARTERVSLLRQLAEATTVNETESIRARLRIVSREIAAAENSLRRVRNRASFANVAVALVPAGAQTGEGAWTPGDAFDDALGVLEVAAGVVVMAVALALPLLALWLLAWLAVRAVTRRRRERSLDLA